MKSPFSLWFSHDFPMKSPFFLWFPYGFPMVLTYDHSFQLKELLASTCRAPPLRHPQWATAGGPNRSRLGHKGGLHNLGMVKSRVRIKEIMGKSAFFSGKSLLLYPWKLIIDCY